MTNKESIDQLRAELEELKAEKEINQLREEIATLKSKKEDNNDRSDSMTHADIEDIKIAAVRQNNNALSHFVAGPFASFYYGAKTSYWTPTLAATGIAVVCVPIAFLDYGITLSLAPPLTSCLLMCNKSSENRRKLGLKMPEDADKLLAQFSSF